MSAYASVTSVGGLLPTSLLERVRAGDAKIPGTTPESYGLVPGERIGDHITRSWNRLQGVWESFTTQLALLPESDRATTLTRERWCRPLLDELGFAGLPSASGLSVDGKAYPISHEWGDTVPVHVMGARLTIDRRAAGVAGAAAMSPHGLVQEYLNRSEDHLWGVVTNGLVLRVLRDNASLTKQAFVEFDLEAMFASDLFSDFVVLWLTCHRTRFEGEPPEKCLLEQWSNEAAESGTRALDKLRDGVEAAITALGSGFMAHPTNGEIRDRLRSGNLTTTTLQHEVLRVVYRLLFLLVAESRDLLHAPDTDPTAIERYKRFYSVDRLRTLAAQRRGSNHDDLWTGLTVTMHGLWHDGVPGLGLTPLGSSLWSPDSITSLANAHIDNRHLLDAIRALCFVRDAEARSDRAVDYKNLGAEELGSIYESLLELHAEVDVDARTFALTTAAGNERKTTGSYYTPTSLISELLDSALDPVLDEAARAPDPESAILDLKVIDPAAGSGHFLIAAAHRIAGRLASIRAGGGEPAPDELRHALRDVVSNCIHAIDMNPMAVELCKVSMWLEATQPGKPLSFLDHRIVCGNALLGATPELLAGGIPDEAFAVLTGDDKATVTSLRNRNKAARRGQSSLFAGGDESAAAGLVAAADEVASIAEDSIEAVEDKARRWGALTSSNEYRSALLAADVWCAAFFVPKNPGSPTVTQEEFQLAVDHPDRLPSDLTETVGRVASELGFLHWHLAFLDAYDPSGGGGFDVVIGNPPWDQVQYDPRETFAITHPDIAGAASMAKRSALLTELDRDSPLDYQRYLKDVRQLDAFKHFLHASGRFPLGSVGRLNTAPLFVELMWRALAPAGRVGVVTPTGIATDSFTQAFFREMVASRALVSLLDFENREGIFPGVHSGMKFSLLTLSGRDRPNDAASFAFFAHNVSDLRAVDRKFTLSPEDFQLLNPNTGTCPVFRARRDAELTKQIYRTIPVLDRDERPSDWRFGAQLMFMMNTDSGLFLTPGEIENMQLARVGNRFVDTDCQLLPLYEAKMVGSFDARAADIVISKTAKVRQGQPEALSETEHQDPTRLPVPRYWVARQEVVERIGSRDWLMGLRDVTSPTNERTLTVTAIPRAGVGHTMPVLDVSRDRALFLAIANSFALDYVARQKIGGIHMSLGIVRQLPVPEPRTAMERLVSYFGSPVRWITDRILELSYNSWDLQPLARELECTGPPFRWMPERRKLIRAEVDGAIFHLYGLDRDDVDYIMDTFPIVRRKDDAAHGEYQTKRLILDAYDAMAKAKANGTEYQTILDPPPADPSIAHDPSTRPDWADWYLNGAEQ